MKKLMSLFIVGSLMASVSAQAAPIALAKAAELTCHRIERLVTLKKIDETFLTMLHTIVVQTVPQGSSADPYFKSTGSQYPGADGTLNQIDIFMDDQGKALSHVVKPGAAAQGAPVWPDKDPITLMENSLHYVLENGPNDANIAPFYTGFSGLALTQVNVNGQTLSRAEIHSTTTTKVLEVFLKTDGTLQGTNIYNP